MNNNGLDSLDLDIIKEVGNIGAGNAATALSVMLDTRVDIEIPLIKICSLPELPMILGGAEQYVNIIFIQVKEGLSGVILFLLVDDDAQKLYSLASKGYNIDFEPVILEVSNIISGAYVGALAAMIDEKVDLTPPQLGQDMLGALVGAIVPTLCGDFDKVSVLGTRLIVEKQVISGYYVLMLENESIDKLVSYLKDKSNKYD